MFKRHLVLAMKTKKPLVLHIRGLNAADAAMKIMEHIGLPQDWPMHMHAFTDSWSECEAWSEKWTGMKFGVLSDFFDHKIAENLPIDKIILETDAPYFLPAKIRTTSTTRPTLPGDIWFVAQQVAYWKNMTVEEVLQENRKNITDLYGIPPYSPYPAAKMAETPEEIAQDDWIHTCNGMFQVCHL